MNDEKQVCIACGNPIGDCQPYATTLGNIVPYVPAKVYHIGCVPSVKSQLCGCENDVRETRFLLEDALQRALTDEVVKSAVKKVRDVCSDMQSDMEYRIQTDLSYNLASWVHRMFEQAIEAMLKGDEDSMRRYLHCQEGMYNGRDKNHPVIRGKLFEADAIEMRKQIVNAHPELLKNERILDLEDQVKSLVAQVRKLDVEKEEMWGRLRN